MSAGARPRTPLAPYPLPQGRTASVMSALLCICIKWGDVVVGFLCGLLRFRAVWLGFGAVWLGFGVFLPIFWRFGLVFWGCFFCKMSVKSSKMEQKKAHFVLKMSLGVEMTINN